MQHFRRPPKAPPYCQGFLDRHGRPRWYFRRRGFARVPLPGLPWTPEFMAAYEKAAKGESLDIGASKTVPGTIGALVASYYRTADYAGLRPVTQRTYRNILERFRAEHADKRVAMLERRHIQKMLGEKAGTPDAANRLLSMLRVLMRHAVDLGWRKDDPTQGIRKLRHKSDGFTTWEESHIAVFLDHHQPGSRAHLALMLLLYTGQRRGDVVRMGWHNVRDGFLSMVQSKTGQPVSIPILPPLGDALAGLPKDGPAFLLSDRGGPLSPEGFTNWFRKMVKAAGLPDGLSPHGLRKATCRRLAEGGCTPHQIMAISGHQTLAEVTRYTVAASRRELAEQAMASLDRKGKVAG